MTQAEKRIKIAKRCGWNQEYVAGNGLDCDMWFSPYETKCYHVLPDYFNSLDAMQEAEKSIPYKNLYRKFLYLVILEDPTNISNEPAWATAEQRAEAFGRCFNLWD